MNFLRKHRPQKWMNYFSTLWPSPFTILVIVIFSCVFYPHPERIAFSEPTPASQKKATVKQKKPKHIAYKKVKGTYLLTLKVKDVDIRELFQEMADIKKLNLVLDKNCKSTVSLSFRDVPWKKVLDVLLTTAGLGAEVDKRILFLHKP